MTTTTTTATLLLAEDNDSLRRLYKAWLQTEDYTVIEAVNGTETKEKLDESIDLVVLDRRMPGPSGDEILSEIVDQGLSCTVVFISAINESEPPGDDAYEAYLEKPINQEEFLTTIDASL